jgi:hypothetical protein
MAENTTANGNKLVVDARVKRSDGSSIRGTVVSVRFDTTGGNAEKSDRGVIVGVNWDNGPLSYFTPEGLQVIEK